MEMVIAVGANLGQREETIAHAIERIEVEIGPLLKKSRLIETAPLLHPVTPTYDQPNYLNGVIVVSTHLPPQSVLQKLLVIEAALGRKQGVRWGPRTIDLDLICAGNTVINSENLTLPHAEMHNRSFVLGPMMEVAPEWRHPVLGRTVQEMCETLEKNSLAI